MAVQGEMLHSLHSKMERQPSKPRQTHGTPVSHGLPAFRLPEPKLDESPYVNKRKSATPLLLSPGQIDEHPRQAQMPLCLSDLASDGGLSDFSFLSNQASVSEEVRAAYDVAIDRIEAYAKLLQV